MTEDGAKPRGRPAIYNSEFHPQDLLERMSKGETDVAIMTAWNISVPTFYRCGREHPEFKEAIELGIPKWQAAWLEKGINFMDKGNEKAYRYWNRILEIKGGPEFKTARNEYLGNVTNVHIGNMNVLDQKSTSELLTFVNSKLEKCKELGIIDTDYKQLDSDDSEDK